MSVGEFHHCLSALHAVETVDPGAAGGCWMAGVGSSGLGTSVAWAVGVAAAGGCWMAGVVSSDLGMRVPYAAVPALAEGWQLVAG